jgi:uncharacterized protein YbaR (Trm112 family)
VLADSLLEILVCPRSKQPLIYFPRGEGNEAEAEAMLVCPAANVKYRIEDGVPVLLADQAEDLTAEMSRKLVARAKQLGLRVPPGL